jgi:hypothetical protein
MRMNDGEPFLDFFAVGRNRDEEPFFDKEFRVAILESQDDLDMSDVQS